MPPPRAAEATFVMTTRLVVAVAVNRPPGRKTPGSPGPVGVEVESADRLGPRDIDHLPARCIRGVESGRQDEQSAHDRSSELDKRAADNHIRWMHWQGRSRRGDVAG
jgi:hypothetical protein